MFAGCSRAIPGLLCRASPRIGMGSTRASPRIGIEQRIGIEYRELRRTGSEGIARARNKYQALPSTIP